MGQKLSPELNRTLDRLPARKPTGAPFVHGWIGALSLEGRPIFFSFCAALAIVLLRPRDWRTIVITAGPPLVFLAAFAVVGAPHYRYQFQLHPFMLCTILAGLAQLRRPRSPTEGKPG